MDKKEFITFNNRFNRFILAFEQLKKNQHKSVVDKSITLNEVHLIVVIGKNQPRRATGKIRLPLGQPEIRRASARRFGIRSRPSGNTDDRRRVHPRRDCLPENPTRPMSADQRAECGGRQTTARIELAPASKSDRK